MTRNKKRTFVIILSKILIVAIIFFFGTTLTAAAELAFSKKKGLFRVKVSGLSGKAFSLYEDSGGEKVLIDIMGNPEFSKSSYSFSGELLSSVNIGSHPRLNGVIRMELTLNGSKLKDIERAGNHLEVRFKKVNTESEVTTPRNVKNSSPPGKKYRLGAGDKINIEVFGNPDLTKTVEVSEDGNISYPFIGDLNVEGKTIEELKRYIKNFLSGDYIVDPVVSLSLKEYKSQWAYVKGDVSQPGKVYLKGPTKLVDILSEVGGSDNHMVVITKGANISGGTGKKIKVKTEQLYSAGGKKKDILIEHGDLITVPKDYFYVSGEVVNPGSFPYTKGITVLKAISKAGGVSQWGNIEEVEILRKNGEKQKTIVANLKKIRKGKTEDRKLQPEDHIVVHKRGFF